MDRRLRLILIACFGPAVITAAFTTGAFGLLYLLGYSYSPEQIGRGALIFFALWQAAAFWWLWQNWRQ